MLSQEVKEIKLDSNEQSPAPLDNSARNNAAQDTVTQDSISPSNLFQETNSAGNASTRPNKDIWDKLNAIGPIVSGALIFAFGGYCSYIYNQQQLRLQEVQTVEKFLPRLSGDEQSKRAAILAISYLTNTELASKIASIYASTGTVSALQSIAESGDEHEKKVATKALTSTLERLAENQTRLEEVQENLAQSLTNDNKANNPNNPGLPNNLIKLAEIYLSQGHYEIAEPLLQKALFLRQIALGPKNPLTLEIYRNLSDLYKLKGDTQKSADCLQKMNENGLTENQVESHVSTDNLQEKELTSKTSSHAGNSATMASERENSSLSHTNTNLDPPKGNSGSDTEGHTTYDTKGETKNAQHPAVSEKSSDSKQL